MVTDIEDDSGLVSPPTDSSSAMKWLICLLVAGIGTWVVFVYPPFKFEIPAELVSVDPNSSQELQEKRAVADFDVYWKNAYVLFVGAGLFFGSVGFTSTLLHGNKRFGLALLTLVVGIIAGGLSVLGGLKLRVFLDSGDPLTFLSEDVRPLVGDALVLSLVSALLLAPVGFLVFFNGHLESKQRSMSVILSGLLTGILAPVAIAVCIALGLIASVHTTELFPPVGLPVITTWLLILVTFGFLASILVGSRPKKNV